MADPTHACRSCKQDLPATDEHFYRAGGGRLFNWICKPCMKTQALAYKRVRFDRPGWRYFICPICGSPFRSAKRTAPTGCSRKCHLQARYQLYRAERLEHKTTLVRACPHCGDPLAPEQRVDAVYCSDRCNSRAHALARKIAGRSGTERRRVNRAYLGDRDGWRCGLCRKRIDRNLEHPHPLAPSVDHIVPISLGGGNELSNLQLTHLRCNLTKRASARDEQLRLVG